MSNGDVNKPQYASWCKIVKHHGLIVFALYLLSRLLDFTPTRLWILLGEKIDCCCVITNIKKTKPWWQDLGVLLHVLSTYFVSIKYTYTFVAWILIVDMISYNMRVLWFDDLIPKQSSEARKVLSHRRVLFQSLINFTESIFLFGVIYINYCGSSFSRSQIYQASFEVATTLSRPINLFSCANWLINMKVSISIFFLVVVIGIIASVGYKRKELAP